MRLQQLPAQILTRGQINRLLASQPPTLMGFRDRAIIALLVTTGIYPTELVELLREDFFEAGIFVRCTKYSPRFIPFGPLTWSVPIVMTWIRAGGIQEGPLFVHLTKESWFTVDSHGQPEPLLPVHVGRITHRYPLWQDGKRIYVRPRDLAGTYIHSLHVMGVLRTR